MPYRQLAIAAVLVSLLGLLLFYAYGNSGAPVPKPVIETAQGQQCVEDPEVMRRYHADILQAQKDQTVYEGVRGARHSLQSCIDCHASQITNTVYVADTDFCMSCHIFSGVKVDCFMCHAADRRTAAFAPINHPLHGRGKLEQQLRNQVAQKQATP